MFCTSFKLIILQETTINAVNGALSFYFLNVTNVIKFGSKLWYIVPYLTIPHELELNLTRVE